MGLKMKKICALLFMLSLLSGVAFAGKNLPQVAQKWQEAWPWAQLYINPTFKINHFVFLNNDKTVYASSRSSSGMESVYKTPDDAGWYAWGAGISDGTGIITADKKSNHLYLGSARDGIYKLKDGESHWAQIAFPRSSVQWIEYDNNNNALYASVSNKELNQQDIYKSLDGGKTWSNTGLNATSQSLTVDGNGNVYAPQCNRLSVLAKNTRTWKHYANFAEACVRKIAVDKNNILYAGTYYGGVYKSTDHGEHWTKLDNGLADDLHIADIIVDSEGNLYAGTRDGENPKSGMYKLPHGSNQWVQINEGFPDRSFQGVYPAIADDGLSIDNHDTVYAITGGVRQTGQIYKLIDSKK